MYSPPVGRRYPFGQTCAIRPRNPQAASAGTGHSMQALNCLSQPDGLTSPGAFRICGCDRPCCLPHHALRLVLLPLAAVLRHDATCHWQLAQGTTRRFPKGDRKALWSRPQTRNLTTEVIARSDLLYPGQGCHARYRAIRRCRSSLHELLQYPQRLRRCTT